MVAQVVGHFSRSRQGSGLRHRVVIVEEKEYNRRQNGGEVFVHIVLQASARKVSSLHASCSPNFALSALVFSANFWLWGVVVPRLSTLSTLHLRHHGVEVHRQTGYGRRRGRRIILLVVVGSCAWFGIRFSI